MGKNIDIKNIEFKICNDYGIKKNMGWLKLKIEEDSTIF